MKKNKFLFHISILLLMMVSNISFAQRARPTVSEAKLDSLIGGKFIFDDKAYKEFVVESNIIKGSDIDRSKLKLISVYNTALMKFDTNLIIIPCFKKDINKKCTLVNTIQNGKKIIVTGNFTNYSIIISPLELEREFYSIVAAQYKGNHIVGYEYEYTPRNPNVLVRRFYSDLGKMQSIDTVFSK